MTRRYRARCRDVGGRQHAKRYRCKVDPQHGLDEQTSALVTQTWTAPGRAASSRPGLSNGVEHVHVGDMDNAKHFIVDWVAETFGRAVG
jgi:hypothetical protein